MKEPSGVSLYRGNETLFTILATNRPKVALRDLKGRNRGEMVNSRMARAATDNNEIEGTKNNVLPKFFVDRGCVSGSGKLP